MPLWVELMVFMLIIYGAVLALMMSWLQRRARLARLTRQRARRHLSKGRKAGQPADGTIGKSEEI
ncbi:hypothetical protein [Croceicoccus marinus]|jgi:hypothetical protein|uniref:Heme exporter protein D n=1 Tax=Croceicoccus marinus TaxID=450378 RepID=A0A7G6VQK4_9SPHN|nr:hypothetical protein [Croceicoccus marinus]QNE04019.1 hypothetical protein H4O24_08275 [Croceicoccus marinus]